MNPPTFSSSSSSQYALILAIFFLGFSFTYEVCIQVEHDSLLHICHSFTPSLPLNWTSGTHCCHWEGIHCNQHDRITHLNLASRGLNGTISPFLGNLTDLVYLNLSHNSLTGPLPDNLFSSLTSLLTLDVSFNLLRGDPISTPQSSINSSCLVSVQILDLSCNHFYGRIQSSFFKIANRLAYLNVSHNTFFGHIPTFACAFYNQVRVLDFSFNRFNGRIPLGFGKCSKLEVLKAGYNNLTGHLPYDIYSALGLREISLPANTLLGSIGDDIIYLSNLTILELHTNNFSGTLPLNIGMLANIEKLLIQRNNLRGPLPATLFNCTNLQQLNLLFNSFEGNIDSFDFSNLYRLSVLDLGNNKFTGWFPKSLFSCHSLKALRLSYNKLEGHITTDMLALQSLTFLALSDTHITNISEAIRIFMDLRNLKVLMVSDCFMNQALPNHIESVGFENLQILCLSHSRLTGRVPEWLKKLHKLRILSLAGNQLHGSIPSWLGKLPNLSSIYLQDNFFSGEFPKTLATLPALRNNFSHDDQSYLELLIIHGFSNVNPVRYYNQVSKMPPNIDVSNNSLHGNIPKEIGQLKRLTQLVLNHNQLSGNIPVQISNLLNLEILLLSHNQFSGEIPRSIGVLNFLSQFDVSFNNLRGQIPKTTQLQSLDASYFMGNEGLCGPPLGDCNKPQNHEIHPKKRKGDNHWFQSCSIYIALVPGLIVGFWGVCGGLWLNPGWRRAFFESIIRIRD